MRKKISIIACLLVIASSSPAVAYSQSTNGFNAYGHCVAKDSNAFMKLLQLNLWIRCGWY